MVMSGLEFRRFVPILLIVLVATCSVRVEAQPDANAASWYEKAFEKLESVTVDEAELIDTIADEPEAPVSAELRDLLGRTQDILTLIETGSRREYSDFGLDYHEGFEMLMPHLSPLRSITKLAAADAAVRLQDGDAIGASHRIASIYRMSSHLSDDRMLISSLVGVAIFRKIDALVRVGLEDATLNRQSAAVLHEAMKWIDPDDPFGIVDAVMTEQILTTEWMSQKLDEGPESFDEVLRILSAVGTDTDPTADLQALSKAELEVQIDGYDRAMGQMVEAFHLDDATEGTRRLAELIEAVEAGEFGELARIMMPSLGRVHEIMLDARTMVETRRGTLEELASGAVAPEELANAATWYLKAARRVDSMPEPERQALRDAPLTASVENENIAGLLDRSQDIIAILEQGSKMRRCDFAAAGADEATLFMPSYLPGLRDAFRILALDAARRRENERRAAERIAIALRMAGHLESDRRLLTSAVAHEGFRFAVGIAEQPAPEEKGEPWAEGTLEDLREATAKVSRSDPFGYIGAIERTRRDLANRLTSKSSGSSVEESESALQSRVDSILADLDVNQLVYLTLVTETAPDEDAPAHPATQLAPLIFPDSLEIARADASAVRSLIDQGNLSSLASMTALPLTPISADRDEVRRDLRKALRVFAPPPTEPVVTPEQNKSP